jgi:hypothetical protein
VVPLGWCVRGGAWWAGMGGLLLALFLDSAVAAAGPLVSAMRAVLVDLGLASLEVWEGGIGYV